MTAPYLATIPATPLAIGTIRTYGGGLLVYGIAVIVQNPRRWSGPSYATVNAVAPPWVWGAAIATLGAAVLAGSITHWMLLRNVGIYGGAIWIGMFATAVLDVARHDTHVAYTSSILFATLGVAMCWVAPAKEGRAHAGLPPSV